jgi:peptide/nickel transport system permease protein
MALLRLLLRRLVTRVLPLTLTVTIVSFVLIQLTPGTFLEIMTSDMQIAEPSVVEDLRVTYGMDQPLYVQLAKYLLAVAQFDFGFSYRQNIPVMEAILDHLPATLLLMSSAVTLAVLVGVVAGAVAAMRAGSLWDRLLSMLSIGVFAAPSFWVGLMLTVVFSVHLGWLPVGNMGAIVPPETLAGQALDLARHLVLPATALGLFYAAIYFRLVRNSMLDLAQADFVRTAHAKGLTPARVALAHILRNALLPVVTMLGLQLGTVLGGSVVIETVFSWPGIGSLLFDGVMTRDYPVVLGIFILGSLVVVTANTLVDLLYARLDPRVTLE